jgi:diacylglycerol kinase (ATP)
MNRYRRTIFFQNPASGSQDKAAREVIRERLQALSAEFEEVVVGESGSLTERANEGVKNGADLIAVAGGDGTVREIASAMVGTESALGIVPLGTFNNLALSLEIPRELEAVSAMFAGGDVREIDVGVADGRHYFFEAAGVGVDAELFPIGEQVKRGRLHEIWRAISVAMAHRQTTVRIRFDRPIGEAYDRSFRGQLPVKHRRHRFLKTKKSLKIRCSFVVVANGPYYGSNFAICPGAKVDDGLLSIGVFRDFSKRELLSHFWSISRGRYQYHPKLEIFHAQMLEIWSDKRLPVHVDGHPIGTTPVRFEVRPRALRVLVPRV